MNNRILFIRFASYFDDKSHHPENVMTPIDIGILAAISEKNDYAPHLIDTEAYNYSEKTLVDEVIKINPKIVVIKSKSPSKQAALSLVKKISHSDRLIIGFGQALTFEPHFFLNQESSLKIIIKGEPELTFESILQNLHSMDIPGTIVNKSGNIISNEDRALVEDLDILPSPKYSWFLSSKYFSYYPTPLFTKKKMGFMMITRGCPYKCIFCSPTLRNSYGSTFRSYSINRIISEIKYLIDKGIKIIQFRDDNFATNIHFVTDLCNTIIKHKIKFKWMIQTHINSCTPELIDLMKEAGCITIGFGIESGSKEVLKRVNKSTDLERAQILFSHCHKVRMKTVAFFLLGCPDETVEDFYKTLDLMKKLRPDLIQVAIFTAYPGSYAYTHLLPEQYKDSPHAAHHYNKVIYNFSNIPTDILPKLQRKMYFSFILNLRNLFSLAIHFAVDMIINPQLTFKLLISASTFFFSKGYKR